MIEEYLKLGSINRLKISKKTPQGLYLEALDGDSVLLPNRYVTPQMNIGDEIDVFIFNDSEDRYVATTDIPKYEYGEFGVFRVVDVTKFGVFVDWGMPKDLFMPLGNMKKELKKGDSVIGKIVYDEKTDRLMLDSKLSRHIKKAKNYKTNDIVDIIVIAKTPLGYKCIVDNKFEGMLFDNEIFEDIKIGEKNKAFVKNVREDGKLDLSLQKIGSRDDIKDKVYKILKEWGEIKITTKSDPEEIKKHFKVSKKAFKSAVNELIKEGKIIQEEGKIKIKS
jgi:predicted RNA-binding protein (virulence factor B family)